MFDYNQKPDLNITPLVDIMLVLLAILMVTAPVIEFEEPINLPTGSKSQQVQDFKKIKAFDKWMRKIKNIHYHDNEAMLNAYNKIE